MTLFLTAIVFFLNHRQDGNVNIYAATKKLKKKACITKCENIKKPIDIQLTFMLESKIEKYSFQQNMTMSLAANVPFLNEYYYVNVLTYAAIQELESKSFTVNSQNIKEVTGTQVTFISKRKL